MTNTSQHSSKTQETILGITLKTPYKRERMRDATQEEQDYVQGYIDSISHKTEVHF